MKRQALEINSWGKNIYVKIPVVNSKGKFSGKIIKELNNNRVKLNITAVYTSHQVEKILKCINKKTKVIGLTGGQGSGKSTISNILKIIFQVGFGLKTTIFSIDDFSSSIILSISNSSTPDFISLTFFK